VVGEVPVDAAGERHGCGGKISPDQARALCGMSAHPRGRAIMNKHATRLGLAGFDGSSWNSSCARK
jgi:hypothetical protein